MIQKPPLSVAGADQSRNYCGLISRKGIKLEIRNHPARNERKWLGSVGGGAREGEMPETFAPRADSGDDSVKNNVTDAPRDKAGKRTVRKAERRGRRWFSSWMVIAPRAGIETPVSLRGINHALLSRQ